MCLSRLPIDCDLKFTVVASLVHVDSPELGEDRRLVVVVVVVVEHMHLDTCHSFAVVVLVGSSDSCMHLKFDKKRPQTKFKQINLITKSNYVHLLAG